MATDRKRPTSILLGWSVVVVVSLLSAVGIARLAPRMAPIRQGNSEAFWRIAAGVNLSGATDAGWGGEAYFVDDTWAAYDSAHMHGSEIYRVLRSDVSADFDAVVSLLRQSVENGEDAPVLQAFIKWRDNGEKLDGGAALLEQIKRERNRIVIEQDADLFAYRVASEQQFWQRWQRANWYWANMVFEWMFLTGITIFGLWPAIRCLSPWRWAVHVACLPLLFLLPVYLGYAIFSFTSAGPSGGILYPYLLPFCRLPFSRSRSMTAVDRWVLERIPQILEPLSTPIGSPMSLSGMGMPGPTYAIVVGVIAGTLVFGFISLIRRRQKLPR